MTENTRKVSGKLMEQSCKEGEKQIFVFIFSKTATNQRQKAKTLEDFN